MICLPARDRNGENMTKIELNRSELYKRSDLQMGEQRAETVTGFRLVNFTKDDGSSQKKFVLDFESGKAMALNSTNLQFLIDKGIGEYEVLVGKRLILEKQVKKITLKGGETEVLGIFITDIIDLKKE